MDETSPIDLSTTTVQIDELTHSLLRWETTTRETYDETVKRLLCTHIETVDDVDDLIWMLGAVNEALVDAERASDGEGGVDYGELKNVSDGLLGALMAAKADGDASAPVTNTHDFMARLLGVRWWDGDAASLEY